MHCSEGLAIVPVEACSSQRICLFEQSPDGHVRATDRRAIIHACDRDPNGGRVGLAEGVTVPPKGDD